MSNAGARLMVPFEKLQSWWQQRNGRERLLISVVGLCGFLAVADLLLWQPMQRERKQLQARIEAAEQSTNRLAARTANAADSPQSLAARANRAQADIARIDGEIESLRRRVVTPSRMAERMREFVASARGLSVLSFRNMAPQAVGEANAGSATARPPSSKQGLFRHPLEVRVAGAYADIAQWITFIENGADGFYLSSLLLERSAQGRIEARIELFTLGTEATWLTL